MGSPKVSSRIGKDYSQRAGLKRLWEKGNFYLCLCPHTLLVQHIGFAYLQMNYTLCDFFLSILAQPSGTHRPRLYLTALKTFDGGLSCVPWTPFRHDHFSWTRASQFPPPWAPSPGTAAIWLAACLWSPGLGPALHMWRFYFSLSVRRILNLLQWKINLGKMTQLQACEDFWALLSLPSITKLRSLTSVMKTLAKIWVPVPVATGFNFQPRYQTVLPIPLSARCGHCLLLNIFQTFPSSFKEDFTFLSTYFALTLACISTNHFWHLCVFFRKPSHNISTGTVL